MQILFSKLKQGNNIEDFNLKTFNIYFQVLVLTLTNKMNN